MPRTVLAPLVTVGTFAIALAAGAPAGWADRPLSEITCARGEEASFDGSGQWSGVMPVVLGCARLADGRTVQIDGEYLRRKPAPTCLWLTFGPPRPDGLFVCAHRLGSKPRVLLILRHRSPSPLFVVGVIPAGAERAGVVYTSTDGSRERVDARTIRVGHRLADRVRANEPFGVFVAELGPGVELCAGLTPVARSAAGPPAGGLPVIPRGVPLGRPDGWLFGYGWSWGNGYGPNDPPRLCRHTNRTGIMLGNALEAFVDDVAAAFRSVALAAD